MGSMVVSSLLLITKTPREELKSGLAVLKSCGAVIEPWIEEHILFLARLPVNFKTYKDMLLRLSLGNEPWGFGGEVHYKIGTDGLGRPITEKFTPEEIFKAVALEVIWDRYVEKQTT